MSTLISLCCGLNNNGSHRFIYFWYFFPSWLNCLGRIKYDLVRESLPMESLIWDSKVYAMLSFLSLSLSLFVCLSVCLSLHLSVCIHVHVMYVCMCVPLCFCVFVCFTLSVSLCFCFCLSLSLLFSDKDKSSLLLLHWNIYLPAAIFLTNIVLGIPSKMAIPQ